MPAPVVVSQCFPIKTRLAPGCHDEGHHHDVPDNGEDDWATMETKNVPGCLV